MRIRVNGTVNGGTTTSTDASLFALALADNDSNAITLTPGFAPGTTTYTALVANSVSQITLTESTSDANASVAYLDVDDDPLTDTDTGATGHQVDLMAGVENTIKVQVTAEDGTTEQEYTITVTRAGANTAPTATDSSVTTDEDTAHHFTVSEFNFDDTDAGDTLASVTVVTPPAVGALTLDGTAVTAGQVVDEADIGKLVFTPVLNANGTDYASFTFKVSDGTEESAVAYSMTVNVTAVNDAATGKPMIEGTAQVGQELTANTDGISDPDGKTKADNGDTDYVYTYEWVREDADGSNPADIGTDSDTYTLMADDIGKKVKVKVTFTDDADTEEGPLISDAYPSSGTIATAGICDRTLEVRAALLALISGVDDCVGVTAIHLADITGSLNLAGRSIAALKAGDFAGLTMLRTLVLRDNELVSLPAGVFDELTSLTTLNLGNNLLGLESLPAGVFDELTSLVTLTLEDNMLVSLPAGVFDELTSLDTLDLYSNELVSLDAGVFDELIALVYLTLYSNELSSLPNDVFANLTELTTLTLHGNSGAPFAPTAVALPDDGTVSVAGGTVTLDGSGSSGEAWGTNVTYSWVLTPTTNGVTIDDNTSATPEVTIPALTANTELTFTLTVTGKGGSYTATDTATVMVTGTTSSDATLSALTVNDGTTDHTIDLATTPYTLDVGNAVTTVTLTATPTHTGASVSEVTLGGNAIADTDFTDGITVPSLAEGANVIVVTVTAQDGSTTQPYTVTVTRAGIPVTIEAEHESIGGGVEDLKYTLTRTGATTDALTVTVTLTQDQNWLTSTDLTHEVEFAAGEATKDLIIEDSRFSFDPTTSDNLVATVTGTGVAGGTDTVVVISIADPPITLAFDQDAYTFPEGGPADDVEIYVTATLDAAFTRRPSSMFSISISTGTGTAMAPEDYGVFSRSPSFNPTDFTANSDGQQAASLLFGPSAGNPLVIVDDDVYEVNEEFNVKIETTPFLRTGLARVKKTDGTFCTLGSSGCESVSYPVTITDDLDLPRNTAPTATDSLVTTDEDTAHHFAASEFNFNDTDADGTLASVTVVTPPAVGALTLDGTAVTAGQVVDEADIGKLVFTPASNANGTDYASFTFKVSDGTDESAADYSMTVNVTAVNDDATGKPTIEGTSQVGETLMAGTTDIMDADGLPSSFTYQWVRVDADGTSNEMDIGSNSDTYTLMADDEGKKVKVKVSFTDDDGTTETRTSDAYPSGVGTVVAANAAPTAADSLVTTDEDTAHHFAASEFNFDDTDADDTLASVTVVTLPTVGALVLNSTAVTAGRVVAAADIVTLVFTPAQDANGTDYASFTFRVSDGTDESAVAYSMTVNVTAVNDAATGKPMIMGTAQVGQELTAGQGNIADADGLPATFPGDYTFQWVRVDSDGVSNVTNIGSDSITYTPLATDVGKKVKVKVSFTDDDGTTETVTSDAYPASGTIVAANTAPTATDSLVTTDEDTAHHFAASEFNFDDTDTDDTLASVTVVTPPTVGALTLDGTAVTAGDTVTKSQLDADQLTFTPAADGNGDAYASFTFRVSDGTDESAADYSMTVNVTAVNDDATGKPTIEGTSQVGETLMAGTTDIMDADGLPSSFTYQWVRVDADGTSNEMDIGSNSDTYTLMADDEGKKVKVKVSFTDDDGTTETRTSDAYPSGVGTVVAANAAPTAADSLVTTDEDTAHHFAASEFNFSDDAGDTLASVTVVTLPAVGALALDGTPVTAGKVVEAEDIGKLVFTPVLNANGTSYASFTFRVSDGTDESAVAYSMTVNVTAVNDAATGKPTIMGTAQVGQELTAGQGNIADVDGLPATFPGDYTFQWVRVNSDGTSNETNIGSNSITYTLLATDVGKKVKVKVSFTDDDGTTETRTSDAYPSGVGTVVAANAAPTAADSLVTTDEDTAHHFTASEFNFDDTDAGDTLASVTVVTLPAVGALALNSTAVTAGRVVAAADIVTLVFTPAQDANGTSYASFTFRVSDGTDESAADYSMTVNVTAVNDAATGKPTIMGTAQVGQELTAGQGNIADADGLPATFPGDYTFQWVRVNSDGTSNETNIGSNSITYTLLATDVGKKVKVKVSFTDDDGTTETRTSDAYPSGVGTVVAANAAPTAADSLVTTDEDTAHHFAASEFNFDDTDDTLASVTVVTLPAVGALTLDGTAVTAGKVVEAEDIGKLVFTPVLNANGTSYASFTFRVSDGTDESAVAYSMTVNVTAVNDAATGKPTIMGTAQVGQELTAGQGNIADADGLPATFPGDYTFQWVRVNSDGTSNETNIGSNSITYTLLATDVGKKVKVKVSFTDDDGTTETRTSDAYPSGVGTVVAANAAPTATDSLVTTNEDTAHHFTASEFNFDDTDAGDTLASVTVVTLPAVGALTLDGTAVTAGKVVEAEDIGKLVFTPVLNANGTSYASFTFRVSDGTDESAVAYSMTVNVTAVNDAATGKPTIMGTAQVGQELTAGQGNIADVDGLPATFPGDYTFQWVRVNSDGTSNETNIGSNSITYTLLATDVGKKVKVKVSFTDDDGTTETRTSDAYPSGVGTVVAANAAPTATDSLVTTDEDTAHHFTASEFNFDDTDAGDTLASVTVVTLPAVGALALDGTPVTAGDTVTKSQLDADQLTFTPAADGNGDAYASFTFRVSDGTDESAVAYSMTVNVTAVNDAATGKPMIEGTAQVGQELTAGQGNIADADGLPATFPGDYTFQWVRVNSDGVSNVTNIGSDSDTYTLMADDEGKKVKVKVSFTDDGGTTETVTSDVYPASGTITPGTPTNAAPTATDSSVTTDEDTAYNFAASEFNFNDTDADGTLASVTVVTPPAVGALTLDGTAVTAGQVVDEADIGKLVFTPVLNANGTDYASFTFKVSDGTDESAVAYSMTVNVTAVNDAATGKPMIEGTAQVGQELTAGQGNIADADGLPATFPGDYTFQWVRVNSDGVSNVTNIGSDSITYTPLAADEGKKVKVKVSFTDDGGTTETVTSDAYPASGTITPGTPTNAAPTATDSLVTTDEDTAHHFAASEFNFDDTDAGDTLASVTVVTLPTVGALVLDGTAVTAGKVVEAEDIGKLVFTPVLNANGTSYASITFRVSDGTDESAADYIMTVNVTAVNDDATGKPTIEGTAQAGETLMAGTSDIMDADGLLSSFTYQWVRVDSDGTSNEMDIGSNSDTYTLMSADVGKKIRVKVSFTDDADNDEGPLISDAYPSSGTIATAGICDRTPAVRDELVSLISGVDDCAGVTATHLANITSIDLSSQSIAALKAGDFAGLTALMELNLAGNSLASLPAGVFDGLASLTSLSLDENELASLDAGVFNDLTSLRLLTLNDNALNMLPNDVFKPLTELTTLWLQDNIVASFAPTADALPDDGTVSDEGGTVTLDGSGSGGAWGTNVTYSWVLTPTTNGVTFDDNTSATPEVTIPALAADTELIFTLTVTGRGGTSGIDTDTDTATVTVTGTTTTSTDATLSGLTLQDGEGAVITLSPTFPSDTPTDYTAQVANGVDTVVLTATKNDSTATVAIANDDDPDKPGEAQLRLIVGSNTLTVTVTAEDGSTTKTYTITVTREVAQTTNTDATGRPTIMGTAQVGQMLTAGISGIMDADGVAASFTYQWVRVDSDGVSNETDVGTNSSNYTLLATDEGKKVKVKVSFIDNANNAEGPLASDAYPASGTIGPGAATAAGVTVSKTALTVAEEDTTGDSYTVVLDTQPTAYVTVTVAGHSGTDVTPDPAALTFTPSNWDTARTVTVTAADDADTTDDTVLLTHSATSADADYSGIEIAEVTVTVNDNDTAQVTGVTVAPGNAQLAVNWTWVDHATGYKVQWKSGSEGYNTGDRQAAVTPGSITSHTIQGLANGAEYTVQVIATRTGANDGPPSVEMTSVSTTASVTVSKTTLTVAEEDTDGDSYTVVLDTQPTASVTVTVGGHTGTDVIPYPATLMFTVVNWDTARTVTVTAGDDVDTANDTVTLTHSATSTDRNYNGNVIAKVTVTVNDNDTARVTVVTGVHLASGPGPDGVWSAGDPVEAVVQFSEAVTVDTSGGAGAPTLAIEFGAQRREAVYASGTGTAALVFHYVVGAADDGTRAARVVAGGLSLNGATIRNAEGVDAELGFVLAPAVTSVAVAPDPDGDGTWSPGEAVTVTVGFSEAVTVDTSGGTPSVAVLGGQRREAVYATGSGTATLRFAYTVTADDGAVTSVQVPANGITLNGGAIVGPTGLAAVLAHAEASRMGTPEAPALSVADASAAEGGTLVFAVTLDRAAAAVVAVDWATGDGTAQAGEDYAAASGKIAFVPGETLRTVRVAVLEDNEAEGAETMELTLSNATGAGLADATATGRVSGPAGELPAVSVADAKVRESPGAVLAFKVTLDRVSPETVTVDWETLELDRGKADAKAGQDYVADSGTVVFVPGETAKTVNVAVLDDAHDEKREVMVLILSNAVGATIADGAAKGIIENSDHMPKAWLARFGRTVAEQVLDAVEDRLRAAPRAGVEARLAGEALPLWDGGSRPGSQSVSSGKDAGNAAALTDWLRDDPGPWSGADSGDGRRLTLRSRAVTSRDFLTGTSFAMTEEAAGGAGLVSLWGRGALTRFDGRESGPNGDLSLEGEVGSAMLGADWTSGAGFRSDSGAGAWTAGLLLAHSRGEGSYRGEVDGNGGTEGTGDTEGTVLSSVTGLYPYGRYRVTNRVTLWGVAGYGAGTLTLTPQDADGKAVAPLRTDMELMMAALGVRGVAVEAPADGGFELAGTSDVMVVRTSSEKTSGLVAATGDVTRLRLGLEGVWRGLTFGGHELEPSLEVGIRHDGGDAETGFGVDIGAGLAWSHANSGVSAEVSARGLLTHAADGFRDQGIAGSLTWDPRPETDRGALLTLRQTMGAQATGGMDALLGHTTLAGLAANDDDDDLQNRRLELKLGYGFPVLSDRFTSTPEIELGFSDRARDYSLGWRLTLARRDAGTLELGGVATRRESANDEPRHVIGFQLTARW